VNGSVVTSRKGESGRYFSFPRILGIEGVGIDFERPLEIVAPGLPELAAEGGAQWPDARAAPNC
jgi:hypothetical protein